VPAESLVESYQLLADVFHDVLSEQSLDGLLDRIANALTRLIPYDDMHIYEVDMAKREMIPRLARSRWAAEILAERFPFGAGITGWAVEHREPVLANQAHLDPRVRPAALDARDEEETARLLRMEGQVGAIQPGAYADLLIVDGNPLQDVRALSSISLVLMKGERVGRPVLFEQK